RRAAAGLRAAAARATRPRPGRRRHPRRRRHRPGPPTEPPRCFRAPGALAGEHGYLDGIDAETASCDAIITPVVTGHPDLAVVDQMIDVIVAYLDATGGAGGAGPGAPGAAVSATAGTTAAGDGGDRAAVLSPAAQSLKALSLKALSPQARQ